MCYNSLQMKCIRENQYFIHISVVRFVMFDDFLHLKLYIFVTLPLTKVFGQICAAGVSV